MNGSPRILFVADAGPTVGGGHVMRSLTLAGALQSLGAGCSFVCPPEVASLLDTFAPATPRLPADSTRPEALFVAAQAAAFDAVVFDHYGLSEADHRAMAQGRPVLVIDDLADRPLGGELILDSGPHRTPEDYGPLVPPHAQLLLGPAFAPVRPEFAALRDAALARRQGAAQRILVTFGLTDLGGVTTRAVERLKTRIGDISVDIVLGAAAPSRAGLERLARRDPRLVLHIDATDMARLTAEADIAIGAGGSATWERCVLGLPSVVLILAENQRETARALAESGAAYAVDIAQPDFEAAFDRAVTRLLVDPAARLRASQAAAQLCDGQGAGRTAEAFLARIRDITSQRESAVEG